MDVGGARAQVQLKGTVTLAPGAQAQVPEEPHLFSALEPALFLVDGNNMLWRAAHGRPAPFRAPDGRDLTPVFRFFSLLRRTLGTYGLFSECIVCFDGANGWSSRVRLEPAYKANRDYSAKDVGFMEWLPHIRAALDHFGVRSYELHDHEADDVIATLATTARSRAVRIVSTDADYFQLVGPHLTVLNPRIRPGIVDAQRIVQRFGVEPAQWCDFRAIAGDPSDGIPGVPGIGPKRAAELLRNGGTLKDVRHSPGLRMSEARGLHSRWDDICRWREVIRLRTDVPLPSPPTGRPTPRLPSPGAICRTLGM